MFLDFYGLQMSDVRLFRLQDSVVTELPVASLARERHLQTLIERQMETFLGVRFLATEYVTTHRGRIDTLGLDENNCPVIVEYKRNINQNVINQGLFYLDWLLDHKADFHWLVMERLGKDVADNVEWGGTRLLCIASDFTRYDQHAVRQIPRNIELLRYKFFDEDLLLLELVNTQTAQETTPQKTMATLPLNDQPARLVKRSHDKSFIEKLEEAKNEIQTLYNGLHSFIMALGDDVTENQLKLYCAFRKLKNFACVTIYRDKIKVNLALDPTQVTLEQGFSRDVRGIGTWGTGDLEVTLQMQADLERAKPLLHRAYQER